MHITRSRSPITKLYTLGGQILEQVNQAKYLGVMLWDELNWSPHINSVTTSANSTLGFFRRNLKQCPKDIKELAYLSLVRSKLEYAASVWDPHHTSDTNKLEQVQRRAAHFMCNNYSPYSNVTKMLSDLGWQQLKDRHKHIRLALFYKIVHHLFAVPHEDILQKADSRTRSSHNYEYRTLRSYKDPYKFSFFPQTILEWNPQPADIVHSDTTDIFKNRLHPAPSQRRPPPALSWPPAFSWPLLAFRQPHLGPILPHGGLPSIRQVKSRERRLDPTPGRSRWSQSGGSHDLCTDQSQIGLPPGDTQLSTRNARLRSQETSLKG